MDHGSRRGVVWLRDHLGAQLEPARETGPVSDQRARLSEKTHVCM